MGALNRQDGQALGALYTENAINHQVAKQPVRGRDAICKLFADGFANASEIPLAFGE